MMPFVAVAIAMVAIALVAVVWPLLRPARGPVVERRASNASIYRDQFADLDADLARGTLSADQYSEAKTELERRVLDEVKGPVTAGTVVPRRMAALAVGLVIPLAAALLYWRLGAPAALTPTVINSASEQPLTQAQVDEMLAKVVERLKNEPGNVQGWTILARSYYALGRFPEAAAAYEKLATLMPDDADVLTDYADALAMSRNRDLSGPPMQLIERALRINATQWKALAMAGTAAFDRKDYASAVTYWERLKASQPADSPIVNAIQASIDEARQLGKLAVAPGAKPPPAAKAGSTSVSGTVALSPALASKAQPTDTVFIYARSVGGSRMPLAIMRAQVKDLPLKFQLDDSLAMSAAAKISAQTEVVLTARVSRSGSAAPQAGDLEGVTPTVKVGASNITLTIDRAVP